MSKPLDLIGRRFGRLVVLERVASDKHGKAVWRCKCDRGGETRSLSNNLIREKSTSCGCKWGGNKTHGMKWTTEYSIWCGMMSRCENQNHWAYKYYGALGVRIAPEFRRFEGFYAYMGARPEGKSLDRYPSRDGNYEPGNVRWATRGEQRRNRDDTVCLTYGGRTQCVEDWGLEIGLSPAALRTRLKKMTIEAALTTPPSAFGKKQKRFVWTGPLAS